MKDLRGVPIDGKKLAALRDALLLSQDELGPLIGMTGGNLSRLENEDVTGMNKGSFRRLAELAKTSIEELRERIGSGGEMTGEEKLDALVEMSQSYGLTPDDVIAHFQQVKLKSDPRLLSGSDIIKTLRNAAMQSDPARSKSEAKRRRRS